MPSTLSHRMTMLKHLEKQAAPQSKMWADAAYVLPVNERHCTCCKRDLTSGAFRYLELDQRTDTYHDFNDVPVDRSQGWFPFGLTCARKLVQKERTRRLASA